MIFQGRSTEFENPRVGGSIPPLGTISFKELRRSIEVAIGGLFAFGSSLEANIRCLQ